MMTWVSHTLNEKSAFDIWIGSVQTLLFVVVDAILRTSQVSWWDITVLVMLTKQRKQAMGS